MHNYIELLKYRAKANPERIGLVYKDKQFSYREILEQTLLYAGFLKNFLLKKGDRIAILEWNTPQAIFLWMGAVFNGIVPIFINWRLTKTEIEYILSDSSSTILFYGSSFLNNIPEIIIPRINIDNIQLQNSLPATDFLLHEEVVQLYTSGTTGFPKGVILTHKSLLAMVKSLQLELPDFGGNAVNFTAGPLFNIAGTGYITLGFYAGAKHILLEKFDAAETANAIDYHQITNAFLAPAMIMAILNLPDINNYKFNSLRNIHYGGSIMPLPLLKKARTVFNCFFTQGYGLTETSGITTLLRFDDHAAALNDPAQEEILFSAGRPVAGMEIMITDNNDNLLPDNETGEIWIRGQNMSNGYWKSDFKFSPDSWFATGDIGRIDQNGYLYIIDRKNDMIMSGGVNIYPAEIERHLEGHPEIIEVAVIGIPDEKFGERPAVFVNSGNKAMTLEDINNFLKDKIASFKMPVLLKHLELLPRNTTGKILRKELRKPFWKNSARCLG